MAKQYEEKNILHKNSERRGQRNSQRENFQIYEKCFPELMKGKKPHFEKPDSSTKQEE